ncbi:MAG: hypothetical protein FWC56_03400 [Phycisphaerae bacterium]|nr:hypothetical protein [Phycisphaerae bacterium]
MALLMAGFDWRTWLNVSLMGSDLLTGSMSRICFASVPIIGTQTSVNISDATMQTTVLLQPIACGS